MKVNEISELMQQYKQQYFRKIDTISHQFLYACFYPYSSLRHKNPEQEMDIILLEKNTYPEQTKIMTIDEDGNKTGKMDLKNIMDDGTDHDSKTPLRGRLPSNPGRKGQQLRQKGSVIDVKPSRIDIPMGHQQHEQLLFEEIAPKLQLENPKVMRYSSDSEKIQPQYAISIWRIQQGRLPIQMRETEPFNGTPLYEKFYISHSGENLFFFQTYINQEDQLSYLKQIVIYNLEAIPNGTPVFYDLSPLKILGINSACGIDNICLLWKSQYLHFHYNEMGYFIGLKPNKPATLLWQYKTMKAVDILPESNINPEVIPDREMQIIKQMQGGDLDKKKMKEIKKLKGLIKLERKQSTKQEEQNLSFQRLWKVKKNNANTKCQIMRSFFKESQVEVMYTVIREDEGLVNYLSRVQWKSPDQNIFNRRSIAFDFGPIPSEIYRIFSNKDLTQFLLSFQKRSLVYLLATSKQRRMKKSFSKDEPLAQKNSFLYENLLIEQLNQDEQPELAYANQYEQVRNFQHSFGRITQDNLALVDFKRNEMNTKQLMLGYASTHMHSKEKISVNYREDSHHNALVNANPDKLIGGMKNYQSIVFEISKYKCVYPYFFFCKGNSEIFIQNYLYPSVMHKFHIEGGAFLAFCDFRLFQNQIEVQVANGPDQTKYINYLNAICYLTQVGKFIEINFLIFPDNFQSHEFVQYKCNMKIEKKLLNFKQIQRVFLVQNKKYDEEDIILTTILLQFNDQIVLVELTNPDQFQVFDSKQGQEIMPQILMHWTSRMTEFYFLTRKENQCSIRLISFDAVEKEPFRVVGQLQTYNVYLTYLLDKSLYIIDDAGCLKQFVYDESIDKVIPKNKYIFSSDHKKEIMQTVPHYADFVVGDKAIYFYNQMYPFYEYDNDNQKDPNFIDIPPLIQNPTAKISGGPYFIRNLLSFFIVIKYEKETHEEIEGKYRVYDDQIIEIDQGSKSYDKPLHTKQVANNISQIESEFREKFTQSNKGITVAQKAFEKLAGKEIIPRGKQNQQQKQKPEPEQQALLNMSDESNQMEDDEGAFYYGTENIIKGKMQSAIMIIPMLDEQRVTLLAPWVDPSNADDHYVGVDETLLKCKNPKRYINYSTLISGRTGEEGKILTRIHKEFYIFNKNGRLLQQVLVRRKQKRKISVTYFNDKKLTFLDTSPNMEFFMFYKRNNDIKQLYVFQLLRSEDHIEDDQTQTKMPMGQLFFKKIKKVLKKQNHIYNRASIKIRIDDHGTVFQLSCIQDMLNRNLHTTANPLKLYQDRDYFDELDICNEQENYNYTGIDITQVDDYLSPETILFIDDMEYDISEYFTIARDYIREFKNEDVYRTPFGFQIAQRALFIKYKTKIQYLIDFQKILQSNRSPEMVEIQDIEINLDFSAWDKYNAHNSSNVESCVHIEEIISTKNSRNPHIIKLALQSKEYFHILSWDIKHNVEVSMFEIPNYQFPDMGPMINDVPNYYPFSGLISKSFETEDEGFLNFGGYFYDFRNNLKLHTFGTKFDSNVKLEYQYGPTRYFCGKGRKQIAKNLQFALSALGDPSIYTPYSFLNLCYFRSLIDKSQNPKYICSDTIMLEYLNPRIKGQTIFHYYYNQYHILTKIYDEVMKNVDEDKNSTQEADLLFMNILLPNNDGKTAFDFAITNLKSLEVFLTMIVRLATFPISKCIFDNYRRVLFDSELDAFYKFLQECTFQNRYMKKIKTLAWKSTSDEIAIHSTTSYIRDGVQLQALIDKVNDDQNKHDFFRSGRHKIYSALTRQASQKIKEKQKDQQSVAGIDVNQVFLNFKKDDQQDQSVEQTSRNPMVPTRLKRRKARQDFQLTTEALESSTPFTISQLGQIGSNAQEMFVEINAIEFDFIFKEHSAIELLHRLSVTQDLTLFDIEPIKQSILFLFSLHYGRIKNYIFYPFILYLAVYAVYVTYIFQSYQISIQDMGIAQQNFVAATNITAYLIIQQSQTLDIATLGSFNFTPLPLNPNGAYSPSENAYNDLNNAVATYEYWNLIDFIFVAVILACIALFFSIQIVQIRHQKCKYLLDVFNYVDLLTTVLNLLCIVLDLVQANPTTINICQAFSIICMYLKFTSFLRLFQPTGSLLRMLEEIIRDIVPFATIYFIGVFMFSDAFYILAQNGVIGDDLFSGDGYPLSWIYVYRSSLNDHRTDVYGESNDKNLFWAYFVLTTVCLQIIMLNLLIALMADTFARVDEVKYQSSLKEMCLIMTANAFIVNYDSLRNIRYLIVATLEKGDIKAQKGDWKGKIKGLKKFFNLMMEDLKIQSQHQIEYLKSDLQGHNKATDGKLQDADYAVIQQQTLLGELGKKMDDLMKIV